MLAPSLTHFRTCKVMEADQSFDEDDVEEEEEDIKTSKKRPAPSLTQKSQVCFTPFEFVKSYR